MKYNLSTTQDDLFGLFKTGQQIIAEEFWNVMDHPDFPFVTLNSITNGARNFPPYNIIESKRELQETTVRLEMAVAGYTRDRLKVELKSNILTIAGLPVGDPTQGDTYRHRGISNTSFLRAFELKGTAIVKDVTLNDGLLVITFASKEPEPQNVKKFDIK